MAIERDSPRVKSVGIAPPSNINMTENSRLSPVSVVIPCFRCARTIERAFASIAAQTVPPAEVILVDDASGDETWAALAAIANAYPGWVKLLRFEMNQGPAAARNAGWEAASQEYIAFLDADDAWHSKKIEIQYAYLRSHPEVLLCAHGHRVLGNQDTALDWELSDGVAARVDRLRLLLASKFVTPSVMVRRDIKQRFCSGRRYMEDRLLWLEIVCDGGRIDKLDVDLAATYKKPYGAEGLSSDLWEMTKADVSNYRFLQARGSLSRLAALALMIFSLLKFLRRLVKVVLWRIQSHS